MPGGFPLGLEICNAQDIGASLSTGGVSVTGGNAVVGSWTQVIASTTYDIDWLEVFWFPTQNSSARQAFDIGVGGSGNEVMVAQQLMAYSNTNRSTVAHYSFPLSIPSGTRIAARSANSAAADASNIKINGYSGAFTMMEGVAGIDSIGFVLGAGGTGVHGTTLTAGGSAATKGAYSQLVATTSRDYMGLLAAVDTSSVNDWYLFDVAIGGSGSEVIVLPDLASSVFSVAATPQTFGPYFYPIPSGTRVAARVASVNNASATINLTLYGIYQ